MKLSIVATHPIQYQVPWFRSLSEAPGIELKVYFGASPTPAQQGVGFGKAFSWDIPLFDGYAWELLDAKPGPHGARGFGRLRVRSASATLRRDRPDALVLTGWHSVMLLQFLAAAAVLDIPRVVRGESNALQPRAAGVRLLHRMLLARFDAFLCIGRENRRFYASNGVAAEKLFDAPYFVENGRFTAQADTHRPERDKIRSEWGIAPGETCFLFAGKLEPKKRVLDFLRAVGVGARRGVSARALVVGAGALEAEAKAVCREAGIPAEFAGFLNQTEISRAYVAADCLVLPSDYGETWGLVVNEAMASGIPAIVSDRVGCGPDLVIENETGAVFPFGDVDALAQKMCELAADPERLREMGALARERVLRDYSVEKAVEGTLKAVEYVVRKR